MDKKDIEFSSRGTEYISDREQLKFKSKCKDDLSLDSSGRETYNNGSRDNDNVEFKTKEDYESKILSNYIL